MKIYTITDVRMNICGEQFYKKKDVDEALGLLVKTGNRAIDMAQGWIVDRLEGTSIFYEAMNEIKELRKTMELEK